MNTEALIARCLSEYGFVLRADLPHGWPYWCCHHEVLCEMVSNPYERIEHILDNKPKHEVLRRLMEFRPVLAENAKELLADYEAKHAPLWADYRAKHAPLWADYEAKCDALPFAALHRTEYPETKWNGRTIFPEAV